VNRVEIHDNSVEVSVKLLYSASVLERATTCLRDHQDIKFGLIKIVAPEVKHLSSTSYAQSTSQNTFNDNKRSRDAS